MFEKDNYLEELQKLKKASWLTFREIATQAGLDVSYIHRLISGNIRNPGIANVKKVFEVLKENQNL